MIFCPRVFFPGATILENEKTMGTRLHELAPYAGTRPREKEGGHSKEVWVDASQWGHQTLTLFMVAEHSFSRIALSFYCACTFIIRWNAAKKL